MQMTFRMDRVVVFSGFSNESCLSGFHSGRNLASTEGSNEHNRSSHEHSIHARNDILRS